MMATAKTYDSDGREAGTTDLPASLFATKINEALVHEAVVAYLANQRQGAASTKERSDVRGGGAKPYRQKGTGRARAGTIRSPLWRGGGTVFGPHPRKYTKKLTRKAKRAALKSSLTARANDGDVIVVKALEFEAPKTKVFAGMLENMKLDGKTLVVLDRADQATIKSARNIPGIRITLADMVTTYDVMWADKLLLTSDAVKKMEEVFAS
jgi:large subunit ribosomal protein L4